MKSIPVAVCLLEHEGRIPLIRFKRNYLAGYWGLPGGKFDSGEFLPEAAEREMHEEIEVPVKFGRFLGLVDEIVTTPDSEMRILLHVCTVTCHVPVNFEDIDKDEGTIRWFSSEELASVKDQFVMSDYRIIQKVQKGSLSGYYRCRQRIGAGKLKLDLFEPVA